MVEHLNRFTMEMQHAEKLTEDFMNLSGTKKWKI